MVKELGTCLRDLTKKRYQLAHAASRVVGYGVSVDEFCNLICSC